MSVTNYIPSVNCGYKYNKLKNVVYLVSKNHLKDIRIDGGEAYIVNLNETPMKIECHNVEFTENESVDERYKFNKTLRFTVQGYANVSSLEGGCYAIIITTDGVPFMVNVDYPAKATFTYTLTEKQNQTEFTLSSQSNYPTLKLNADLASTLTFKCKQYAEYGITDLQLIEKDYVTINDKTAVVTTFGGRTFKNIEFLKKSCTLTESFDGDIVTDTITFDINFDDYKPSWQYNLLEFMDNLYAAIVTPKSDNNKFFVGFNFGLDPEYTIDTTTSEGDSNKITITLTEKSVHGMITLSNARVVEDTDRTWKYVENVYDYETYQCIDNGIAIYLAMQELDAQNNPTGNYKVLDGWYDYFKDKFNVVGTFSEIVTFYTTKCSWFATCTFTGLPSLITYIGTVCKTFYVSSTCDWHFDNIPSFLTFSRTSGVANETYQIEICNTLYTDVTVTDSFDVYYGSKKDTIGVQIITGDMKLQAYYNNQTVYQLPCNQNPTLSQSEVRDFQQATHTQMTEAIIGACVETVGSSAFYGNVNMTGVTIPSSVQFINDYAFYNNYQLKSIDLPDSLNILGTLAFANNSGATHLDLGNGVTTIGSSAFYNCFSIPSVAIPNSVTRMEGSVFMNDISLTSVTISNSLTSIPIYTFYHCISLPSVVIPNSVTKIENHAFSDCSALTSVTLSSNLQDISYYAFSSCSSLPSITLPNSLVTIDSEAFSYCTSLTSVTIPSGVTMIGTSTFYGDTALTYVRCEPMTPPAGGTNMFGGASEYPIYVHCDAIPAYQAAQYWKNYAHRIKPMPEEAAYCNTIKMHAEYTDNTDFDLYCNSSTTLSQTEVRSSKSYTMIKEVEIGDCVNTIGSYAIYDCDALTSVTMSDSVQVIDTSAFNNCSYLPSISLSSGLTTINSSAFQYCDSITSITLPNSLTYAGNYSFASCTAMSAVTIGSGLGVIAPYMFYNCSSLDNVTIPSNVHTIGEYAFQYCTSLRSINIPNNVTTLGSYSFSYDYSLTNATIGSGVATIQNGTFSNDTSLVSVTMTDNVTGIQQYAFNNCSSLPSIRLSESLNSIGNYAFQNCSSLSGITIPATVTSIGSQSFYNCTSMQEIWCLPTTPPTLSNSNAFNSTNECPIYVPCESLAAYQTANQWKNVKSRLRGFGNCPTKVMHRYTTLKRYSAFCDSDSTLTSADTRTYPPQVDTSMTYPSITNSVIGECVQTISANTYYLCYNMTGVTIPNSVTTIGNSAFNNCTTLGSVEIPNSVTSLGSKAFYNNISLTSLTISSGLTSLNSSVFCGCSSLPSVVIPDSIVYIYDTAFILNSALTSLTLSNSLQYIGSSAFESCTMLPSVTLPNSLKTISERAFKDCERLTAITIPSGVTSIGAMVFSGDSRLQYVICEPMTPPTLSNSNAFEPTVSNPDYPIYVHCSVLGKYQKASQWAYLKHRLRPLEDPCVPKLHAEYTTGEVNDIYCDDNYTLVQNELRSVNPSYTLLKKADIGDCVSTIGTGLFQDCELLEGVTMTPNIYYISGSAFKNCSSMSGVTMSPNINYIGADAFYQCTSLSAITLTNNLTTIGNNAFYHCANITGNMTVPNSVTSFGTGVFSNCYHITSVSLPNTITTVPDNTFQACLALTSVTIPNTVTKIGKSAFEACIRLTGVTIPNTVTEIGNNAFENCEKLRTLTIPSSVTNIGAQAFYYCSGLTSITMEGQKPPILSGESVFDFTNDCPIYVPCMSAYAIADGWSEYAGRMVEYGGGCNLAMQSHYSDNTNFSVFCFDLTDSTLTTTQTRSHTTSYTAMTSTVIGSCVNVIGSNAFDGCSLLTAVTIGGSVVNIGNYAFRNCSSLGNVTLPNSLMYIGSYAFQYCDSITSITLPNNLNTIDSYAFNGCTSLTSITLPTSLSYIGSYAFRNCSALTGIYCSKETAPTLGGGAFDGTTCPIYLPTCESWTSYANTSGWSSYKSRFRLPSDCPSGITVYTNNQWSGSTSYGNLSSAATDYDFYESYSNWHVANSSATTYIELNNVPYIEIYVRSWAESGYDYIIVKLDNTTLYSGSQNQSETIWNKVGISAGVGMHSVSVTYRKDSSVDSHDDKGYLAIPKNI